MASLPDGSLPNGSCGGDAAPLAPHGVLGLCSCRAAEAPVATPEPRPLRPHRRPVGPERVAACDSVQHCHNMRVLLVHMVRCLCVHATGLLLTAFCCMQKCLPDLKHA